MLKSNCLAIFFLLVCAMPFAQDSLLIPKERPIKKAKLIFAFDARRSFVLGNKVKLNGLKVGIELHEKYRFGLGFYAMSDPVEYKGKIDQSKYPAATDTLLFQFNYFGSFHDYVWLRTKRWELTSPIHLGIGGIEISYLDTAGHRSSPFIRQGSFVLGAGAAAQFKIWRWLALGTGGGYRRMLTQEENIKRPLNAPYYQFQVKILLGELYRMAFRRETLEEW